MKKEENFPKEIFTNRGWHSPPVPKFLRWGQSMECNQQLQSKILLYKIEEHQYGNLLDTMDPITFHFF